MTRSSASSSGYDENNGSRRLTLSEFVEAYLAQHDVQPVTIQKLRSLLSKATAVLGDRKIGEPTSQRIAECRGWTKCRCTSRVEPGRIV